MNIQIAYTQHSGKQHHSQQDALWNGSTCFQLANLPPTGHIVQIDDVFLALADGVSVSPSPQLASRFVLEELALEVLSGHPGPLAPRIDARMVRHVHCRLCDRYAKGRTIGSATTLVAGQIQGNQIIVLNVGDSRAYRIVANGDWQRLSHDHTVIEGLIADGKAERNRDYARLYDALEHCLIADDEEDSFPVHRVESPFLPGDTLLLCTDGVHDALGEAPLQHLFDLHRTPQAQVEIWRNAVMSAGAPDNFSMIVARYHPDGS